MRSDAAARTAICTVVVLAAAVPAAWGARRDAAQRIPVEVEGSVQNPCWSPDGTRLVFTEWTRGYNRGPAAVRVVPVGGGVPTVTLSAEGFDSVNLPGSCWDRATDSVVFTSDPVDGERDQIYIAPAAGGEPRRVTAPPEVTFEPSFSPDGAWITYESHRRSSRRGEIWKVRADGSGSQRLTKGADDRQPSWSPAGDRILFQRHARSGGVDLWTVSPQGGKPKRVTRGEREETDASWSPSGKWIVFSGDGPEIRHASIFTMTKGGKRVRQLTRTTGSYDGAPAWSPDGSRIAFESTPGSPERHRAAIWSITAPDGRR